MEIAIHQQQLSDELETLASFSDAPAPAVTRLVFSPADLKAREYVRELCAAANPQVRVDAVGNTLLFIPCRGGVSHRLDEYAAPEDICAGSLVLARTLAELAA